MAGCSNSGPNVVLATSAGVTPIYTPNAPPLVVPPGTTLPRPPVDRSGTYAGIAVPLNTGGGLCLDRVPVKGFRVRGKSVHFGGYRGTIDASEGLQMLYGRDWIVGQFEGAVFQGQLVLYGNFGQMCSYLMTLQRVGA